MPVGGGNSVTFGFYDSVGGDRAYNAMQMSRLFDGIINDGVFMSIEDALMVSASTGMSVIVGLGRAWFNHTWTNNDAALPLTIEQSEVVLHRIDTVILEIDANQITRANTIKILKGTPSSMPVAPTLTNTEFVHQYPLAHIYVGAGVTAIIQSNITNTVGTAACPFITGILSTISVDALVAQWAGEFDDWMATIVDILDESTAGNLLNLINELITKGTSTLPATGWVANTGDNALKYNLAIAGVIVGNWVDVTIDKNYQDVALAAGINPTVEEYAGGITFFADTAPTVGIPIRYKVVK